MAEGNEVVILGGGVAGCAVAYYLALAGVKSTIIEREPEGVGTQASGYSAGGLNPLEGANIPGPLGPLAIESYRMHLQLWDALKSETGIDYQGHIINLVKVAFTEADLTGLAESFALFSSAGDGFSAGWLERNELLELEPRLNPAAIRGLRASGNAALDSYQYTVALSRAAQKRGATLRYGTVNGLKIAAGGRVAAVLLDDGGVAADRVVLALGPWSREAEPWLDIAIPVDPLKGEILRMELPGRALRCDFSGGGGSLHAKPDGLVWCGTTEEWKGFDKQPSDAARQSIMRGATNLIPELEHARLVKHTACLRPVTSDWLPILGKAPGWENVYLATGAGKKGILLSPGIGKSIADLITTGSTDVSIGPCSPARFGGVPD